MRQDKSLDFASALRLVNRRREEQAGQAAEAVRAGVPHQLRDIAARLKAAADRVKRETGDPDESRALREAFRRHPELARLYERG